MMGMCKWARTWVQLVHACSAHVCGRGGGAYFYVRQNIVGRGGGAGRRAQSACSAACTMCMHACMEPSPQLIHHEAPGTPSLMARPAMICSHPCGSYPAARGPVNCSRACALGQGNARRAQHSSDLHISRNSKCTGRNHASMVRQATKGARARTSWRSWRR